VTLQSITDALLTDTLETSLPNFGPELVLCAFIVVMLLVRIFNLGKIFSPFLLALVGSACALWTALPTGGPASWAELERCELFTGMLVYDTLTAYLRVFLAAFLVMFVLLSRMTHIADREEGQDYYALAFGATLGMCIMASANHLITIFLGVEMASVPSYVLAGIIQGRRRSSEAALKYAIYGAGTAGVMLYGISLLAGILGSAHLPTMAGKLVELDLPSLISSSPSLELAETNLPEAMAGEAIQEPFHASSQTVMVLALGGLMMGVGLAFKLSAVPFHFWCPDVFEGASAEVGAFLSVASKGAALALLLRVGLGLGTLPIETTDPATRTYAAVQDQAAHLPYTAIRTDGPNAPTPTITTVGMQATTTLPTTSSPLSPVRYFFVWLVSIISIVTCTFGNLAAYGQKNIKRMLAYSTIAHAGYMMMGVAATVALVGHNIGQSRIAVEALLLYMSIYFFMNLTAFAIVAFLRNAMQSEEICDYGGLIRQCPVITVCMVIALISLLGIPPMAGFWGKLRILQALFEAGGPLMMVMVVVAVLNTAISLVYYLRVAKTMCIDPEPDERVPIVIGFHQILYVLAVSLPILIFGILPEWLANCAHQGSANLLP
jgi:NADH-quinone oxidoreductase subunit N